MCMYVTVSSDIGRHVAQHARKYGGIAATSRGTLCCISCHSTRPGTCCSSEVGIVKWNCKRDLQHNMSTTAVELLLHLMVHCVASLFLPHVTRPGTCCSSQVNIVKSESGKDMPHNVPRKAVALLHLVIHCVAFLFLLHLTRSCTCCSNETDIVNCSRQRCGTVCQETQRHCHCVFWRIVLHLFSYSI